MGKLEKYSSYKDSGVEWLGEIPEHWEVQKIKFVMNKIQTGTTPSTNNKNFFDGDLNWFNPKDLNQEILIESENKLSQLALDRREIKLFPKNSILIVGIGATTGKTSYLNINGTFNQQITGFHSTIHHNKFLFYVLRNFSKVFLNVASYTTLPILNNEFFKSFSIVLPPKEEQIKITSFLDKKTTQIDEVISQKEKLIELLKERKQIVINDSVTKGLDKNVEFIDSGVEWIGEIPNHWGIKKMKYLGTAIIGLTYSPNDLCNENDGTLVLRSSNLQDGKLTFENNVYVKSKIPNKLRIKENDILICSRNGSRDLIGKCAIAKKEDESYSFGAFTTVFRSKLNTYLFKILNSQIFKAQSGKFLTSTINQLTVGNLNSFELPIPPKDEQLQIVEHIENQTAKIDKTIELQQNYISKLKEYKASLIDSVVTGKVRVA